MKQNLLLFVALLVERFGHARSAGFSPLQLRSQKCLPNFSTAQDARQSKRHECRAPRSFLCASVAIAATLLCLRVLASDVEPGFQSLFNGKDLSGWDGNPKLWSVKDGVITGQTTPENPTKGNTFLIWTNGTTADFELRFEYKTVPNNDKNFANSGVQYRSRILDAANRVVGGYQADFEAGPNYSGILYDEGGVAGGRQIMAARGEKVIWDADCKKQVIGSVGNSADIQATIKAGDWNEYVVIAKGHRLQHFINGRPTVDVTDDCEAKRLTNGVLALQLHSGPPMTVQFRNLRLKQL